MHNNTMHNNTIHNNTLCFPYAVADRNIAVYEVLSSHFYQLVNGITQPIALARALYSKRLISETDKSKIITNTGISVADKATMLMNAVEATMKNNPRPARVLRALCEAMDSYPALEPVVTSIKAALG